MSEQGRHVRQTPGHTDTLIGAGLRVEGNIASTGVLRIQGDVLGDVTCDADSGGTVVVGKSGSVAGTVRARRIVVSGRVLGPLHSSESIEVQPGALIAGDAFYRAIDIQAGGVLEGTLTPCGEAEDDRSRPAHRRPPPEPATASETLIAPAGMPRGRRRIAAALALVAVVVAVALLSRPPAPVAPPAGEPPAAKTPAPKPAPAESAGPQDGPKNIAAPEPPAPAVADANARPDAQAPPPESPEAGTEQAVKVQGVNPAKPAGFFLLIGKEPSVLFRKKRQDPGEGTRLEVAQGAAISIPVAKDEIVRVAEGRDIEIFYQGRKVPPKTIESGAWMRFIPQAAGGGK